ncbi:hypothetical protein F5X68DRAFT_206089 [Plectosphaerella plurivora]|uniref:Secreted protein n=1 Tax=Plectosphaerella plurivora TaxID=936078 RepID=A0A9P9A8R8_9PEZI|nr:hypothetical protein F5X68DRAFT_206089 [Plectosphaerella plurivora]
MFRFSNSLFALGLCASCSCAAGAACCLPASIAWPGQLSVIVLPPLPCFPPFPPNLTRVQGSRTPKKCVLPCASFPKPAVDPGNESSVEGGSKQCSTDKGRRLGGTHHHRGTTQVMARLRGVVR